MQAIQPYLFFNGNCREAMEFYAEVLGGKLGMITYGQGPNPPDEGSHLIMHAKLSGGAVVLLASDPPPNQPMPTSRNFALSIACDSRVEEERLFAALGVGGRVLQPLQRTFWEAYFGMIEDKFGVMWMLSHDESQE